MERKCDVFFLFESDNLLKSQSLFMLNMKISRKETYFCVKETLNVVILVKEGVKEKEKHLGFVLLVISASIISTVARLMIKE